MIKSVTLDDMTIVKLLSASSLYREFPKLETLFRRYNTKAPINKSCNCRTSKEDKTPVIREAKEYIRALPANKKQIIKSFFGTEFLRMSIRDATGRNTVVTW